MLMDAIVDYLPSPLDLPDIVARSVKDDSEVSFACDPAGPPLCLVFKLWSEDYGFLHFTRIYSGCIKTGMTIFNPLRKKRERISRIFRMHAGNREDISEASAGDIIAITGLKESTTGDTLCSENKPVLLEKINFTNTVVSRVIEPKTSNDRAKVVQTISRISREDPSFEFREDEETGQYIISGMGELHLEVTLHRMTNDFKVDVNVGKLRVSYREAPTTNARATFHYENTVGGELHIADVELELRHNPAVPTVAFINSLPPNSPPLSQETLDAIKESALSCATHGDVIGYPLIHLEIHLTGVKVDMEKSSTLAFCNACNGAFNQAIRSAKCTILEPIMRLEAYAPEEYIGTIIKDLGMKRGEIMEMGERGQLRSVLAKVPLSELFGYADQIRSLSQGRAHYTMEPERYSAVSSAKLKDLLG